MSKQKLELMWIGKDEEIKLEPRILVEDTKKSYGDPKAENMLIHGDNLLALKALEQEFADKIKCIYIDPPFNTGAAFDHYDDSIEHSIWLQLMRHRLERLRHLLRDDGCIFVQLDDCEASYCKVLLDEIFGRSNYVNEIIVATNKAFGFKGTSTGIFKQANHILFYAKNKAELKLNENKLFIEKEYDPAYSLVFENTDRPEAEWTWRNITDVVALHLGYRDSRTARKEMDAGAFDAAIAEYAIENATKVFQCASVTGGAYLKRKSIIEKSKTIKDKIMRHPNDDMDYMFIGGRRVIFYSERLVEIDKQMVPGELLTDIWTDISIEGLAKEGGVDFPKGKKPEKLIQRCIELTSSPGDYVLDSFLGSGTTSAVAHKIYRRWIGIELGGQASTHCVPRLRAVVDGSDQSGISKAVNWKGGGGFRFYELAPSLLRKDKYGNWIIDEQYNAKQLVEAMCKQEGFKYFPDESVYWKQGKSTENDYIFVTTSFVTVEQVDKIHAEMKRGESLLICAKSFAPACKDRHGDITLKKIPQTILGKCEFGKDNYDLNIINISKDAPEESED